MAVPFFGTGMKTDLFQSCGNRLVLHICWHIECSTLTANKIISLSYSVGTRIPTQVEDGNFRLSPRSLEHRPLTSPPTNQKKVTHPAAHSKFCLKKKNLSPNTMGEFRVLEHEPSVLSSWSCNKPFSAQKADVPVCLFSLCVRHMNCSISHSHFTEGWLLNILPARSWGKKDK